MTSRSEGHFNSLDQHQHFYQTWESESPKGSIIVTHGLGEHSECYSEFGERLSNNGWSVFGLDLIGHGRSQGKRGYVSKFDDYVNGLKKFVSRVKECHHKTGPIWLFGHSMGGLITIRYTIDFLDPDIHGVCLSSPLLGIALKPGAIKVKFAKHIGPFLPKLTLNNEIKYEDLHRDKELLRSYEIDPLRHDKISPLLFTGMLENCELSLRQAGRIKLPLYMQVSGDDRIVDSAEAERFFAKVGSVNKSIKIYPESLHETFNDLNKDNVYQDLFEFLDSN